jgi:hypothetical protein
MVAEHNNKTFIPLLMVTFCFLNLEVTCPKTKFIISNEEIPFLGSSEDVMQILPKK